MINVSGDYSYCFIHDLLCNYGTRTKERRQAVASSSNLRQDEEEDTLETFQNGFCDIDAEPNSNGFITKYVQPQPCELLSTKTYNKPIFLVSLLSILIPLKQHDDNALESR